MFIICSSLRGGELFIAFLVLLGIDEDFTIPSANPINLEFPVNSQDMSQQCVNITIVDDDILEGEHAFSVRTGNPSVGTRIILRGSTVVKIQDNEGITYLNILFYASTIIYIYRHSSTDNIIVHWHVLLPAGRA